jgi:hypothetical protein
MATTMPHLSIVPERDFGHVHARRNGDAEPERVHRRAGIDDFETRVLA